MTAPGTTTSADPAGTTPSRRRLAAELLRGMRPRQWVKNVLVLAAPAAAGVLTEPAALLDTALTVVAFCMASGGIYLLNDVVDIEADRRHPGKRHRPVAAGTVSRATATATGAALLVGSLAVGALTGRWQVPLVLVSYLALTVSYSLWLKRVAVVDLVAVAGGFVLRAVAGAAAVDVPISSWFLVVTSLGSLFVVAGKRESELRSHAGRGTRSSLDTYTPSYLNYVRAMSSGATIVAYCLWALDQTHAELLYALSIVPFVTGILRYAMLVDAGSGEVPEEIVIRDRLMLWSGVVLAVLLLTGIYAT